LLSRYQTGPVLTVIFFTVALGMLVFDIVSAVHLHHRNSWINAAVVLVVLFSFDRYYRRHAK
jgi:hypothetical protein